MLFEAIPRRTALAVSSTAHAVQDGLSATIYVLLPILAQTFGFTYTQVGLFNGIKSVAQAIPEMYSGALSERVGEGRTLIVGLVFTGIGYIFLATAKEAVTVVLCLLIVGVGTAFQHAPASALVGKAFATGGRRSALGLYNSSGDVGKLAFSASFSLAVGAGIAWKPVAVAFGIATLIAAAAIAAAMRGRKPPSSPEPRLKARSSQKAIRSGWGILHRRSFSSLIVIIFLDTMVQAGVLVFVAFLVMSKGFPLYTGTLAAVLVMLGGIFGKVGCGYLAERIGVRRAFVLVQVLTAIGLVSVTAASGWLVFVLLPPLGVVAQGSTSITYGIVADLVHPERMARGFALMYGSTSIAAAGGSFAFGLVGDNYGINAAMLAMAIVALLAILPIILLSSTAEETDGLAYKRDLE